MSRSSWKTRSIGAAHPPNKALHRTLANVAKIHHCNHSFRVAEDMLGLVERR